MIISLGVLLKTPMSTLKSSSAMRALINTSLWTFSMQLHSGWDF